jgi:hypothetical protein
MAGITAFSKVIVLLLIGWGILAGYVFNFNNGLFPALENLREVGLLPGTDLPLRTHYTGIKAIDSQLVILVGFFWCMVDGGVPDVSLLCVEFLGQAVAVWVVCVIEGSRSGNKGRLVSL